MTKKLLFFSALVFLLANAHLGNAQNVFINEVHYDNTGPDAGEAIEIAGPAGTNLTGWSIVLYNGSGGAAYTTTALSGSIPNQQNGFGTIAITYPSNGIQNGSPDGIALVDPSNTVVQFLSYEGTFTAVGGAANGITSTDIGVSETGTEVAGNSLQLVGTGSIYSDFSWQTISASSPGTINAGQVFGTPSIPVLINEFVFDHIGANTDEFVEVISLANTDLSQYALVLIDGDGTESGMVDGIINLGTTGSNGIFVTPFYSDYFENGSMSFMIVKNFTGTLGDDLDTNNDGIFDIAPWETITDNISVTDGGIGDNSYSTVVLSASFDGGTTVVGGASRIPNGTNTGNVNDWTRNDFEGQGLPSFPNALAQNGEAINTPGAENEVAIVAVESNIIINEVDADTEGTDALEFIELYDGGAGNTILDGYVLVLYNGSNDLSYASYDLTGFSTNNKGYFVLGNSAVKNVNIIFNNNFLQNGADAVAIFRGTSANFPTGTVVTINNLVDAIVYDTDDADDTGLLVLLNAGQVQLNESGQANSAGHSMQRIPNGLGGARNTSSFSLLAPTPGTVNGEIVIQETITILEARNVPDGNIVRVAGVLTVTDQFKGAAYLQDATAGIAVFDSKVHGPGLFNIGDSITITGTKTTYNGQTEISPVSLVVDNGPAYYPIIPADIALSEMSAHPDELVRITNPMFPLPGNMMFGNSNYIISDAGGNGEIRIDTDAPGLAGLAQPEICSEIIGVVGKYIDIFQLLPRIPADMACADKYQPSGNDISISKDLTLDVAAWNIEWFGDESNSPAAGNANSDQIQKDSVKSVLLALDADIIGVEEISDDVLFAQMVNEMPGYSYVLSDATSYPNDSGVKQKVGFIYKTASISPISTKVLLASIHPYYNGGNTSFLTGYPDAADRFYASGRMPFMLTANVTINGATKQISFIGLHARANSSDDPQLRYDMRKFDVEVLKDSLDNQYASENIVMVGDYNDDVDVTVANISTTVSSFQAYVDDAANYNIVTSALSNGGYRSYVFEQDMIDHIMISNELTNNYINGSEKVHYEYYNGSYTNTTSDHLPISARLQLAPLKLIEISSTDVSCFGNIDGSANINVNGGIQPYAYSWSTGQTTTSIDGLMAGSYSVKVSDATGNSISAQVSVGEPAPLALTLNDPKKVYRGYPNAACTMLSINELSGGTPGYTYQWSNAATTQNTNVCPTETSHFSLLVTDANNCSISAEVEVKVSDIRCYFGYFPKVVLCYYGYNLCVPVSLVQYLLPYDFSLGYCNQNKSANIKDVDSFEEIQGIFKPQIKAFPNPFLNELNIEIESLISTDIELLIYNTSGQLVHSESKSVTIGKNKLELELDKLNPGVYILRTSGMNDASEHRIIKQ